MEPLSQTSAIIDFCLAPLSLDAGTEAEREVRRRLEHVMRIKLLFLLMFFYAAPVLGTVVAVGLLAWAQRPRRLRGAMA